MPSNTPQTAPTWVVYVSTFPPRECGIATFTQDLTNAFDEAYGPREEAKIVAMNFDETVKYDYDTSKVIFQIPQPKLAAYVEAAHYINSLPQVSIVNIQHEFGIFGGSYGRHLLHFLREVTKPIVITFHTVLPSPNPELRETVIALSNHVTAITVMTALSKNILIADYAIPEEKITLIPHGIHPTIFNDGTEAKKKLGLTGAKVISTFGLLSSGKGIEYGIEAMVDVVKKFPDAKYLIIGATHPAIVKNEGERYRSRLETRVHDLGLEKNVVFHNKFLTLPELLLFLEATDIYLALSQEPNQAVSGTLSYALGSGRSVVSTAFAQAREDVTNETGFLVGFKEPHEISSAIRTLLSDDILRRRMGENAYFRTRSRVWNNVVLNYMRLYMKLCPRLGKLEKNLPRINLDHIRRLTDSFGMIQFAKLTIPDPASGYTVDDNARALIALLGYHEKTNDSAILPLIEIYFNFIAFVAREDGGFHNYVDINQHIPADQHIRENLESASSRALYAVARTACSTRLPNEVREKAAALFSKNLSLGLSVTSPRSIAYFIKALSCWNTCHPSPEILTYVTTLSDKLIELFNVTREANWNWFEDILAYSNGIMPDALIDAYRLTKNETYLVCAREAVDFLIGYSFEGTTCVPIGQSGWLKRGNKKHLHDQQPEEVAILVLALKNLFDITHEEIYRERMYQAFNWFLGNNLLNQVVYNQSTGGCYDGVGEKEINLNQGAESTVMYLTARLAVE